MRNAKWISPVIVGLGLASALQAATAGLSELLPGALQARQGLRAGAEGRTASTGLQTGAALRPAGQSLRTVQKVELLPPVCQPVQPYVPPVKACEQVQAPKACEPVKGCDGSHELVVDRLLNKVDRAIHATAYKIHAWKQGGYVEYSAPPQDAPLAPAPASAPANVPTAPVPARSSNS